jgi:AAA+ superfamily predicted ATPase
MSQLTEIDSSGLDAQYLPVVRLWALRALMLCNGARNFVGESHFRDQALARMLGFARTPKSRYSESWAMKSLQRKLDEAEREAPPVPSGPVLARNLQRLAQRLGLNDVERDVLHFTCVQQLQPELSAALEMVDDLTRASVCRLLADCLARPVRAVQAALDDRGRLCRSALLAVDDSRRYPFGAKIDLLPGLAEALMLEHDDLLDLFGMSVVPAPAPQLSLADFGHLGDDLRILRSYIDTTARSQTRGVNVLLYGRPGTGKTELVRALAAEVGAVLMEIPTEDPSGKPRAGRDRFESFRFAQSLLAGSSFHMLLFDEVEDVFATGLPAWLTRSNHSGVKGWVNQMLEHNAVPSFWITNSLEGIDAAYLRRFDLVLEMDIPPASVRRRLVDRHVADFDVPEPWRERVAEHVGLAPAVLARAARVAALVHAEGMAPHEVLTRVMNQTLQALGAERLHVRDDGPVLDYRLDLLNADCDLPRLQEGLRRAGEARLCLYGPPGTGKTAFARHLARELDRPLMVKRASDILSPYVGVAERNIARMFAQAEDQGAVLVLDEADSLLRDRHGAQRSWEITQVNEMLTQMETFRGVFIASTNLMDSLDAASMRRFDARIRLGYLAPQQAWEMFVGLAASMGLCADPGLRLRLDQLTVLTPGDFASVARQCRLAAPVDAADLVGRLRDLCSSKHEPVRRSIGFVSSP